MRHSCLHSAPAGLESSPASVPTRMMGHTVNVTEMAAVRRTNRARRLLTAQMYQHRALDTSVGNVRLDFPAKEAVAMVRG